MPYTTCLAPSVSVDDMNPQQTCITWNPDYQYYALHLNPPADLGPMFDDIGAMGDDAELTGCDTHLRFKIGDGQLRFLDPVQRQVASDFRVCDFGDVDAYRIINAFLADLKNHRGVYALDPDLHAHDEFAGYFNELCVRLEDVYPVVASYYGAANGSMRPDILAMKAKVDELIEKSEFELLKVHCQSQFGQLSQTVEVKLKTSIRASGDGLDNFVLGAINYKDGNFLLNFTFDAKEGVSDIRVFKRSSMADELKEISDLRSVAGELAELWQAFLSDTSDRKSFVEQLLKAYDPKQHGSLSLEQLRTIINHLDGLITSLNQAIEQPFPRPRSPRFFQEQEQEQDAASTLRTEYPSSPRQ